MIDKKDFEKLEVAKMVEFMIIIIEFYQNYSISTTDINPIPIEIIYRLDDIAKEALSYVYEGLVYF